MINLVISITPKFAGIWWTLLFSAIFASALFDLSGAAGSQDGPLSGGQAFLMVNAINAAVLTLIAVNARVKGWRLALLIGGVLYMVQSFLLMMEALYFIDSVKASSTFLLKSSAHIFITCIAAGGVAAFLWRGRKTTGTQALVPVRDLLPRIALISALYVLCYFIAGLFIAWGAEAVREYYGGGLNIALFPLLSFQLLRGTIWGLMALYLIRNLHGSTGSKALIVGLAFSVLATSQLLYPSTFMPWEVRFPHLIEVTVSNFIFGGLAAFILLRGRPLLNRMRRDEFETNKSETPPSEQNKQDE